MKTKTSIPIIGAIIIGITCLMFFILAKEPTVVQWTSFTFMIFAELIAIGGVMAIGKYSKNPEKTMFIAGMSSLIWIYLPVSLIVSLIFVTGLIDSVTAIITIQLIILAVTAIIAILMTVFTKSVSDKNKATLQSVAQIKQIQDDVFILMNDERNSAYRDKLEKIYEAIRYCDNATYVSSDDKIVLKVMELETVFQNDGEDKDSTVDGLLNEIILLTKKRTVEVQNMKRGGI